MEKRCPRCETVKPITGFGPNPARSTGRDSYCRECKLAYHQGREQHWREEALRALGGECAHCGIEDLRVLCIDHVDGGGTVERRRGGPSQAVFYRKVALETIGFQALCWNCNWLKRLEHDTPTYAAARG